MAVYPASARERAMKVEEVILRAVDKQITFWQAARIARLSPRHLRRLLERYRRLGFDGLYDRRKGRPSPKRVPWAVVEQVLGLYREKYFDFSVRHFHEKLREEHGITYSYTCIKRLLQGAGLVMRTRKRGPHRRKRERRPMIGMMLHIDASSHRWLGDEQWHDLLVVLDDATSQIYYAQLVEQESTATALAALRAVVEQHGIFCTLYSDRGSHFWLTPKEGEIVDRQRLTQVGRAMRSGHRDDPGLFAASARAQRAQLWHLAAPAAARTAATRDHHGRGSQPLLTRALHNRAERQVLCRGGAAGERLRARHGEGSGAHFLNTTRTGGEPGQHGARSQPHAADRAHEMAKHAGQISCAGMRTLGWHLERVLRTAPGRPLRTGWLAVWPSRIGFSGERESRTPRGISALHRHTSGRKCRY